ncbi:MAG: hypothetical protein V7776_21080 [Halopseudomonas aestusnigri]
MRTLHKYKYPRILVTTAVFFALIFIAGCQTTGRGSQSSSTRTQTSLENTSLEAKTVATALLMRLHGEKEVSIEEKISVKNAGVFPGLKVGQLDNWYLHGLDFYDVIPPKKVGGATYVNGVAYLRDDLDRGMKVAFFGDIVKTTNGYELISGHWQQAAPLNPRTELYIVPLATMSDFGNSDSSYKSLQNFAQANAIPMKGPNAIDTKATDYAIFVFVKDQLLPDSQFAVKVSDVRRGTDGYSDLTSYHVFEDGWATAVVKSNFAFNQDKAFWIKALYTPKGGDPRIVGLYNSSPQPMPSS